VQAPAIFLPTLAQAFEIIGAMQPGLADIAKLLLATGARRGEILGLDWESVDLDNRTIRIDKAVLEVAGGGVIVKPTKTKTVRTLAITEESAKILKAWDFGQSGPVFVECAGGRRILPTRLTHDWVRACEKVGYTFPLKNLRHLNASLLLAGGVPLPTVAQRTGHADGGRILLARYAASVEGSDKRASDYLQGLGI
jgi:integrase